jgi:hypothetical protein
MIMEVRICLTMIQLKPIASRKKGVQTVTTSFGVNLNLHNNSKKSSYMYFLFLFRLFGLILRYYQSRLLIYRWLERVQAKNGPN